MRAYLKYINLEEIFITAVKEHNVEAVKDLIKDSANVHVRGNLALRHASYYGFSEVVKVLLKAGADVHAMNDAALTNASQNGHTEIVKLLKKYA